MTPDQKDAIIGALTDLIPPGHGFVLLVKNTSKWAAPTDRFDNVPDKKALAEWLRHCARSYERQK